MDLGRPLKNESGREQSSLANILRRCGTGPREEINERAEGEAAGGPVEELGCFGWLTDPRDRAEMLELRRKTGAIAALPYAWIDLAEFDPAEGITLHARGGKTTIWGRNLNAEVRPLVRLFQGIVRRRVAWVKEAEHGEELVAGESATVIQAITW